ncbi:MAG: PTS fructose transporter subunit IIC [Phycisphaerales bacterium]|nr:PTS fructose transporter subunit IIC [Phycisphaerales bacterium]
MRESLRKVRQHLLTGVSYMIPFVACGGILIAAGLAFSPAGAKGLEPPPGSWQELVCKIGAAAFTLMLPVLGGYIAHAIAGKPGLVPGFVGGFLAAEIKAGFLGAILIGFVAGWIVEAMKRIAVPKYLRPIMPILVIPIVGGGIVGVLMLGVLGPPIANLMALLTEWLGTLSTGSAVALAMVLGAMIAFDMGGPVNKVAFLFGAAMIKEGNYAVMGACAAAICTPPLGMGLATLVRRSLWSDDEREAGKAALAMGMIGITEGAIPFAASDPLRVIPSIMVGSMVAATVAMLGQVGDPAPHGGPIVLPVVDGKLMYIVAIVAGMIVTALMIHALKRPSPAAPGSEASR